MSLGDPQPRFHLAGVMGWPVAHSRSPAIHGYWLAEHHLWGAYLPLAIPPERLAAALRALPALGFAGCNLTIPLKEKALSLVDAASAQARRIGAINCVTVRPDGTLYGENHDGWGWLASLIQAQPHWSAAAGPAVVIGAGGAARAIIAALADEGAPEIRVVNRSIVRGQALAADLGGPIRVLAWEERHAALAGAALLVNTTSLGMEGQPALDLSLAALPASALVSDIVYVPRRTALLAAAASRGNPVVEGSGMLLHQARPAFAGWFGIMPEVTEALRARVFGEQA